MQGTIKCSNLCTEIVEYSSPDEIAVCNLASIALNRYVLADGSFDFHKLRDVTHVITRNLNKIIDVNHYPVPEAKRSNLRHRPIGIGVQGLADAYILMRLPFDSDAAALLNRQIFETIYYAALEASCALAERDGPYATYAGSPMSKGVLQPDMWGVTPTDLWDWATLRAKVKKHGEWGKTAVTIAGARNSLLLAPMPTASTAQILGNNESMEPYTSNIYSRRVLSGEFQVVNPHLLKDLVDRGLWTEALKNDLIAANGSVQQIDAVPDDLKKLYKTVWELSQRSIIDQAADRGAFIDQSQSLNIHIAEPNFGKLTSESRGTFSPHSRHALLRLAQGPEDRHVLSAHEAGRAGRAVHRRQAGDPRGESTQVDRRRLECGVVGQGGSRRQGPEQGERAGRRRAAEDDRVLAGRSRRVSHVQRLIMQPFIFTFIHISLTQVVHDLKAVLAR